jgi:hypothetical protein
VASPPASSGKRTSQRSHSSAKEIDQRASKA